MPVDKWAQVISDPTIGDAIVDRIIYNAHRIELKGTSMREKSKQNGPAEEPSLVALRAPRQGSSAELSPETKDAMKAKLSIFC